MGCVRFSGKKRYEDSDSDLHGSMLLVLNGGGWVSGCQISRRKKR